jgi:ankyrin repeat protein
MTASERELNKAIRAGEAERVLGMIRQDARLLAGRLSGNETPLMLASHLGHYGEAWRRLAEELLALGAPLDLFSAITLGRNATVCAMLRERPELTRSRSPGGWTALHYAARYGGGEVIEALLEAGANVNEAHPKERITPLFWAFPLANAELLLARGADVHHRGKRGFTVLHSAAAAGDTARVALLLRHGASRGVQTDARQTPWALAVRYGHREAARLLGPSEPRP